MDNASLVKLISLIILVLSSAFFSSAETALISCNKIRIKTLADSGDKKAITLNKILNNHTKMIGTILVGNNIANIGASSLTTSLTLEFFGSFAVSITAGLLTLIILIWGEILPKSLASIHSNKMAMAYAPIIKFLMFILTPIVFFINMVERFLIKIFKLDKTNDLLITESELKELIDVGHREGVLESEEKTIINNLLEFSDDTAQEVMTPRIDMVFVHVDDSYSKILKIFKECKFTRFPVYKENKDEIIGIINIKDLLLVKNISEFKVTDYLRESYFTYENKRIADLLYEMRQACVNLSIIVDEYGATVGLITLEDLLEELVGEIRDEYDEDETDEIIKNNDNSYTINAMSKLEDINSLFNINLNGDGYDTIAGYITETLDHIPSKGEYIVENNIKFTILETDNKRIVKILAKEI